MAYVRTVARSAEGPPCVHTHFQAEGSLKLGTSRRDGGRNCSSASSSNVCLYFFEDKYTLRIRPLFLEMLHSVSNLAPSTRRITSTADTDCISSRRAHPSTCGVVYSSSSVTQGAR